MVGIGDRETVYLLTNCMFRISTDKIVVQNPVVIETLESVVADPTSP